MKKLDTWFIVAVIIALCLPLLWPGDAPFGCDESRLLLLAIEANNEQKLADAGLYGTVGLTYGPIPTWIYQAIISTTTNPANWVRIRAGFMVFSIAFGLFLLARAAGLWKWFIPVVLVSPYVWYYSRMLWDNCFNLAFSSLAVGFYAYFLYKSDTPGKRNFLCNGALLLSAMTALVLPFIHFMAIPVSIALFLHMGIYARKGLREIALPLSAIMAIFFFAHAPYIGALIASIKDLQPHTHGAAVDFWKGWVFPLLGGRLLTGGGLKYFFGENWLPGNPVYSILQGITYMAYPLSFAGMFIAGKNVRLWFRICKNAGNRKAVGVRSHFSLIALVSIALQCIIGGITRSYYFPHYHNGIFIIHVVFAWLALDWFLLKKLRIVIVPAYGISMAAIVVIVMALAHERSGTRDGINYYGATIGNQLDIARKMGREDRNFSIGTVEQFIDFPEYCVFQRICLKNDADRINGPVTIEYANDDTRSGLVRVRSAGKTDYPIPIECAKDDSLMGFIRIRR